MIGLTSMQAQALLKQYGANELRRLKKANALLLFLKQFTSPLILLLIGAALISLGIGYLPDQEPHVVDASLILCIVFISGVLGFYQEYKAEQSVEALQKMASPESTVMRDGTKQVIKSHLVVPGDVVLLTEGDIVPADGMLTNAHSLQVDESSLTGESLPVERKEGDSVCMSTQVLSGNATMTVRSTGMQTTIGNIASTLDQMKEEQSPFEQDMTQFSKKVVWATMGLVLIVTIVSLFKYDMYTAFLLSISLAVAAIPEGLPAIVALTLTVGATSMSKKNALIRKLSVTESIGDISMICTDKTGTITENDMTVTTFFVHNKKLSIQKATTPEISALLTCGVLCTNAEEKGEGYTGDPTEVALLVAARRFQITPSGLLKSYTPTDELPFSSDRKMMSKLYMHKEQEHMFTKGAPEVVLQHCSVELIDGVEKKLTGQRRLELLQHNTELAAQGMRVLGCAQKVVDGNREEKDLLWLGLQAMIDPARPEVKDAIAKCYTAGIKVMMLTGDNPVTAEAIAADVGLTSTGARTGAEVDGLSDEQLQHHIDQGIHIFARVSPAHKLRILSLLKKTQRVAMTGDGVNDALALKKADVGLSMGIRGTEVAKQASDIMLLDDNFATIVDAIKEGRRIFGNIRKFINYLFITNLAEVLTIFIGTLLFTLSEPLLIPAQLLWINLLTDGLPALALGADPAPADIMSRPVRSRGEPLINKPLIWSIVAIGVQKTIMLLGLYLIALPWGHDVASTILFTGFVLFELVSIGVIRSQEHLSWYSNKLLLMAITISLLLQLTLIYSPLGQYFGVVPLGYAAWALLGTGTLVAYVLALWISGVIWRRVGG